MAKVASSFKCMICQQRLAFPDNCQVIDFMILMMQFYRDHERCESIQQQLAQPVHPEPTPKPAHLALAEALTLAPKAKPKKRAKR